MRRYSSIAASVSTASTRYQALVIANSRAGPASSRLIGSSTHCASSAASIMRERTPA